MNLNNFTIKAQEMLQHAQQLAFNNQNPNIETAHLPKRDRFLTCSKRTM
jgi:ATP-dependent Clp protease ATP-binding subunit ClpB